MALTPPGHTRQAAIRRAVESAPPLNATATGSAASRPCSAASAGCARTLSRVGFGVGEAAIALEPLVAPLQHFALPLVTALPLCIVQRSLQLRGHLLVLAV